MAKKKPGRSDQGSRMDSKQHPADDRPGSPPPDADRLSARPRRKRLDLFKMARDPKLISGIYNYCDRWCERCAFTGRCMVYAQEQANAPTDEERDIRNAAFWDGLRETFQQVREMIEKDLKERGITLTAEDLRKADEAEKRRERRAAARKSPLSEAAFDYLKRAQEWFKANESRFEEKGEELASTALMQLPGADPEAQALDLNDALEIVQWYHMQIAVKLERALSSKAHDDEDPDEYDDPEDRALMEGVHRSDADGSAKVALIGVDRSLAAWARLREHFPEQGDAILDTLVHLDRLRRAVEAEFPDARAFQRPGFDT